MDDLKAPKAPPKAGKKEAPAILPEASPKPRPTGKKRVVELSPPLPRKKKAPAADGEKAAALGKSGALKEKSPAAAASGAGGASADPLEGAPFAADAGKAAACPFGRKESGAEEAPAPKDAPGTEGGKRGLKAPWPKTLEERRREEAALGGEAPPSLDPPPPGSGRREGAFVGGFGILADSAEKSPKPRAKTAKKKKKETKVPPERKMPKRARKILTLTNPEVLLKVQEIKKTKAGEDPKDSKDAKDLIEEKALIDTNEGGGAPVSVLAEDKKIVSPKKKKKFGKKEKLSRKNRRLIERYGLIPNVLYETHSSKKLLNYRMLFSDPPIERMDDGLVAKNIRLLLLAYSDRKFPPRYDKFFLFLKNSMCFGISDFQLKRLIGIMAKEKFISLADNGAVQVNVTAVDAGKKSK
ncbi:MAG: hypothetical protein LBR53_13450 [Deltaproteobacteria bacterium]|jgi:hypothetical protein|nr:hypothetical protein [Deltaproteobacteria bacterium]